MKRISPYRYDMEQNKLSEQLQRDYKYPLLNFAFVIAKVLAGIPLFSKSIEGKKISEIKKEIEGLKRIRLNLLKNLDRYVVNHFSSNFLDFYKNFPLKEREILLVKGFELHQFFSITNERLELLKSVMNEFDPIFKLSSKNRKLLPYSHPMGNAYQIYFLWAFAMHKNEKVQWKDIQNVHTWFLERLDGSTYVSKLDFPMREKKVGANIDVLKNQYIDFKNKYRLQWLFHVLSFFPRRTKRPFFPKDGAKDFEDPNEHIPVVSIKFYKNKVKTLFYEGGKLKVLETSFKMNKSTFRIREYNQAEEKTEGRSLLLDIE